MGADAPLVAVFVGTDHHRFDRLLDWVTILELRGDYRFYVQHGFTPLPGALTGVPMMGSSEMDEVLQDAAAVVTHAGPGSIMDAREHGHVPVVVPRDPTLGEHVDDHQQRFTRFLSRTGMILAAHDHDELAAALAVAVQADRTDHPIAGSGATLARFENLVDRLVHR